MKPEDRQYAQYRLSRADEALDEARLMLEHGHLHAAVSRLYYACFYAVSALLLTAGLAAKKHSGVIALFDRHWVNSGEVAISHGRLYRKLFENREMSDYLDLAQFERAEVEKLLSEAEQFVETVSTKARESIQR